MQVKDMAKYMKTRRGLRRAKLLEMAGGVCSTCGDSNLLEFNHRERTEKLFTLSGKGLDTSWERILVEFAKCDLLCVIHHAEYTKEQWKTGEIAPWNSNKNVPHIHGTARCYHETKCRCRDCTYAKKLYRNKEIDLWTEVHL